MNIVLPPAVVFVVLAMLVALVLLNLLLTLRLASIVQQREYERLPLAFPVGVALPAFHARRLRDGAVVRSETLAGAAAVLVFLSPACGDCLRRRVELIALHPAIIASGIGFWVFGAGARRRVRAFLEGTPLADHAMSIAAGTRRRLNPRNAAPFYLFVDAAGVVVASGFIGDDDWRGFDAQMREALEAAGPHPVSLPDGAVVDAVAGASAGKRAASG